MSKLTVWVDKAKCTGSGLCLEECPSMFEHDAKGKALIKTPTGSVAGVENRVEVPAEHQKTVRAAFDACPTSAIFIEG